MSEIAPATETEVQQPLNEAPPPVDDAAAASAGSDLLASGPEASAPTSPQSEPAPAAEPTPTPEPPAVRTLQDIDSLIATQGYGAVSGAEFAWWNQQVAIPRQQREQAEYDRQQKITQAFPNTVQDIVSDTAELFGIIEGTPDYIALTKKVEDRLLHGDESLHSVASQSVIGPIYDAQSGWLFERLGRTREAGEYIRKLGAAQMLDAAEQIGARKAANAQVEPLDDAKIEQLAKGELKAAGKNLPFEGVQKAIDKALEIERVAHGREPTLPQPGAPRSGATSNLTWAQVQRMDADQLARLSADDYEAAVKRG